MQSKSHPLKTWFLAVLAFAATSLHGAENADAAPKVIQPGVRGGAPSDAIVLFDGGGLDAWESSKGGEAGWTLIKDESAMEVKAGAGGIRTKKEFGDVQLHVEWASPSVVKGDGQGRGNSGVYLQGRYEIQVLDSFQNETYHNGQAGSFYGNAAPLVNASFWKESSTWIS